MDGYLFLTPILVLPLVLLFVFVGCDFHSSGATGGSNRLLKIFVRFHPARQDMNRFIPIVDITQGESPPFPTTSEGPTLLPDGDSQFELSNEDFILPDHFGSCSIQCSIYLDRVFGPPTIGPIFCEFSFNYENETAVFVIDMFDNVTTEGCLAAKSRGE